MDPKLNATFHVLYGQLPKRKDVNREAARLAIIWEVSNYEINNWSLLNDDQAREAIKYMQKQVNRLNKAIAKS